MDELALEPAARERIWWGTAAAWLGRHLPTPAPRPPAPSHTDWPARLPVAPSDDDPDASLFDRPLRLMPRCC